jgi:AcrR family transcriptional regulator
MRRANEANREKFIIAAAGELEEHGVSDFSIRRVARRCGLSCAAPYKHFESRNELMLEVIRHINKKWLGIWSDTVTAHKNESIREQLVAVCMAYLTFLCTYPEYQTIIFMNDRIFPAEMREEKGKLSTSSETLIASFGETLEVTEALMKQKTYAVRSYLYGAAIMINSGEMPFNSETMTMVRESIERELDAVKPKALV